MKKYFYILLFLSVILILNSVVLAADAKIIDYGQNPPPKSITVTSPNSGEYWLLDSSHNITWTSSGVSTVRIQLSTDNGNSWQTIVASQNASLNSYQWDISSSIYSASTQALVKVFDISDLTITDVSDNTFTLSKLEVLNPTLGTKFKINANANISWSSSSDITNVDLEYSIDGIVWNSIATNINAGTGSYTWFVPNVPSANAVIRIKDSTQPNVLSALSSTFSISSLQLLSPNGGEIWFGGSRQTLSWNSNTVSSINIQYSTDNGLTWISDTTVSAASQNFSWIVPSTPTNEAIVKLVDVDASNVFDESDNKFTINAITISLPNGNEGWTIGSSVSINWSSNLTGNVKIELSTDKGISWGNTIVSGVAASTGNYNLSVPNLPTNQALIKISNLTDLTQFDVSDSVFTIGQLTITKPTAGELLQGGSVYNILWNATPGITTVKIEYTTDGTNYTPITISADGQSGTYSWLIPTNLSASSVNIRISDASVGLAISDISAAFSINSLNLTSPIGGELLTAGTNKNITWTRSSGIAQLSLSYSSDNGFTWNGIANSVDASLGTYSWSIPSTLASSQMLVRIQDLATSAVSTSNSNFTVGSITVLSPNGGEKIFAGSTVSITWNVSNSINNVNLQYSLDGGTTFNNIVTGFQASTLNYTWTVPASISSNNAMIRVYDSDGLGIADSSNLSFTIANLRLLAPNGGEGYLIDAPITINWTSSYVDNIKIEYSSGGAFIPFSITTSALPQSYIWTLGASASGETDKARFRISDADNPGYFDYSDSIFTIERVTVNSPNGSEILQSGTVQPISWYQSFTHNMNLEYSSDNGTSWNSIVSNLSVQSPYDWAIPNASSANVKIRVANSNFTNISDASNSVFSIENLQLTSPNGGEYLLVDSTATISWNSNNVNNVKLEYSTNSGLIWTTISNSTPAASGFYNWLVPNTPSRNTLIKISDADNISANITDISNNEFVISVLSLIAPNGGENFVVNSTQTISWVSSNSVGNVNLEFSANNGASWSTIASGISALQQNYKWTIPNNSTTSGLIRIIDSGNTSQMDTSDAVFSIGSIQLTSPSGGEQFQVDSLVTITWTNIASITSVNLAYSTDNGVNWNVISNNINANLERFLWRVPNAPTSNGKILIYDTNNSTIFANSNANFTISNITVTSPNGGEVLQAGSPATITWTSALVNSVEIDYSVDGGLNWISLVSGIAANFGSLSFTVPNTTTANGLIRISDSGNLSITDKSDNVFAIEELNLTYPTGGEGITEGKTVPITWTANNVNNLNIEYSKNSGLTWVNIAQNISASSGVFNWVVPFIASSNMKIKISDALNVSISDSSSDFTTGFVSVTTPSTGQTWQSGSVQNIRWSTETTILNVKIEYTTDNLTWNIITNSYNALLGNYVWTIPSGISTSLARVKVSDANNNSTISDSTGLFIITSLTLTSPNGGEYLESGIVKQITWESSVSAGILLTLQYSTDNGINWNFITSTVDASAGFYNWSVPTSLSSKTGLVKISRSSDPTIRDSSDAVFNFGKVQYISPTAGTFLQSGKPATITWQSSTSVDNVAIDYSTDGGTSWANITSTAPASAGSYNWAVPSSISTNNLKIRVSDAASNLALMDQSGILSASYLNLLSPVGSENWLEGTTQTISWSAGNIIPNINIDYSIDAGVSWNSIAANTSSSAGSLNWTVPTSVSNNATLIRIIDVNNSAVRDSNSILFTISNLVLTAPNGGENWQANTTKQVFFSTSFINTLNLDYSIDNGITWTNIFSNKLLVNGNFSFNWDIPTSISTTQAKVRVVSSNDATQVKESNTFTITKLNLLSPIGGENWQSGATQTIQWESGNVSQVNLHYSTDQGSTWNTIAQNINASLNSFDWSIPAGISTNLAMVKIEDANNTAFSSRSNGTFTISSLILTSPIVGTQTQTGKLNLISWQNDNSIQNISLEYSTDGGSSWISIASNLSSALGSIGWTVPNTASNQAIVRVFDTAKPSVNSESGLFTISELQLLTPDGSYFLNSGIQTTILWSSSFVNNVSIDFSTDSGSSWNTIGSSIPAASGSLVWNVPVGIVTDAGLVRVRDAANQNVNAQSFTAFRVGSIGIVNGNGGEFLTVGNSFNITWNISNNITNVAIDYSTNDGLNWNTIASKVATGGSSGGFIWTVPSISSSTALIRVSDFESTNSLFDVSDNYVTITNLAVTSPNGGENLRTGSNVNIQWISGPGISTVKLEYQDKFGLRHTIANNVNASLGQYSWSVPNATAVSYRIRISSVDNPNIVDYSDASFRIAQLDLTAPNGSEVWQSGTNQNISWINSSNVSNVDIYYSTNSGINWNVIATAAPAFSVFNWALPGLSSTSMLIKVVDAASNNQIIDTSNSVFTISKLQFTNPIGGENIIAGSSLNVKWISSSDISQIDLTYTTDGGGTWNTIQNNVNASLGSYSWNIPSTLNSTNSALLIKNSSNNTILDTSGIFNIYQAGFSLISPNGNEYVQSGRPAQITWSSGTSVNFVDISYSLNSGASWVSIITNYDASLNSYEWIVPSNISSENSRIKIVNSENNIIRDSSDLDFAIRKLDLLSPNGGEVYQSNTTSNIIWNSSSNVANVKIELSTDSGLSWVTIKSPITASIGSYAWLVNNTPSTNVFVKISDLSASNIVDTSNSAFTISQLLLTYPNGGERIKANETVNLSWVNSSDISQLQLQYSTNGVNWNNISSSAIDAGTGSYSWLVPDNICTTTGFVRISDFKNLSVSDINDAAFTFSTLDVLAPLAGQIWTFGTNQNINWTTCDIQKVKLEYSLDSGFSWITIVDSVSANSQTYSWTIPNVFSNTALIRITDVADVNMVSVSSPFILSSPAITLTAPQAGDNWQAGNAQVIKWLPTSLSSVNIDFSDNNGITWSSLANNIPATDSQYVWNIPDSIETTLAVIKVTDNTGVIKDSTHGTFTISSLKLTSPIGGEYWQSGNKHLITWNAGTSVSNIRIQYSLDFGITWNSIAGANNINSSLGLFNWNLPTSISSDSAKIRIVEIANTNIISESDTPIKFGWVKVNSPNGNEIEQVAKPLNVMWDNSSSIKNVTIQLLNASTNSILYAKDTLASAKQLTFSIPLNSFTDSALIQISDAESGNAIIDSSDNVFKIVDLKLLEPIAGTNWQAGSVRTIRWSSNNIGGTVTLQYSPDNGASWNNIVTGLNITDNNYNWSIPSNLSSNSARVKIIDDAVPAVFDTTGTFNIFIAGLNLNSPVGGEYFNSSDSIAISWMSTFVSSIKIEFSPDNGVSWSTIASSVLTNSNLYKWLPPANLSTQLGLIKISDVSDSLISDISNTTFTVGWLNIINPSGGENVIAGKSQNISWGASSSISNINLFYTIIPNPSDTDWVPIALNIPKGTTSYTWNNIPNIEVNNAKIVVADASSNKKLYAYSNSFKIVVFRLLSPNGGESWLSGQTKSIQWAAGNSITSLAIDYSLDNGLTWEPSITNSAKASDSLFNWTIPNGINSDSALVRITDVVNSQISDTSDAVFQIGDLGLLSFNGGEKVLENSNQIISWSKGKNTNFINLDYKLTSTGNWNRIVNSYPADSLNYLWSVPSIPSDSVFIRITDSENLNYFDVSNSPFTIIQFNLMSLNGGEVLQTGSSVQINWESKFITNISIAFSTNDSIWVPILPTPIDAGLKTFTWNIPLDINAANTNYKIRLWDTSDNSISIVSKNTFTISHIKLLQPNGGGGQQVGTEYNITWLASLNTISQINLFVKTSLNGDFVKINASPIDASLNNYLWRISTAASPNSQIKITDADNPVIFDTSDSLFTISEIKLVTPNGGRFQKFQIGRNYDITWTSNFVDNVNLEYKLNESSNDWLTIDQGVSVNAAAGSFNWDIKSGIVLPSRTSRVRISDSKYSTVRDVSDTTFIICSLVLNSPNERIPLKAGNTTNITWSSVNVDSVLIFLNPGNGNPLVPIAGPINANINSSFQWQVPANLSSGEAKIRVADFDDSKIYDESDTTFVIGAFPKFNVSKDFQKGIVKIPWEFGTPNESLSIINVTYQKVGSPIVSTGTDALNGNYQNMVGPIESDTIKWDSQAHLDNFEGLVNLQFDFKSDFNVVYSVRIDSIGIDNLAPRFDNNSVSFLTDKFIYGWDKALASWNPASDTSKPISYKLYLSENQTFPQEPAKNTTGNSSVFTHLRTSQTFYLRMDINDKLGNVSSYNYSFKTNAAADYNDDNIIDGADLSAFVKSWSIADSLVGADLYPYTDVIPTINIQGDLLLDVNDILAFVNMWNYYQVNRVLPKTSGGFYSDDETERNSLKMKNGNNKFEINIPITRTNSIKKSAFSIDINYNSSIFNFDSLSILHNNRVEKNGIVLTHVDSALGIVHIDYADLSGEINGNYKLSASLNYFANDYSVKDSMQIQVNSYDENLSRELVKNYIYTMTEVPTKYELYQNYPNPFNPTTTIVFDLPAKEKVVLEIYDILGRKMTTLINEVRNEGHYKVQFNTSKFGLRLASGVYLYRIVAGKYSKTKKMLLLK